MTDERIAHPLLEEERRSLLDYLETDVGNAERFLAEYGSDVRYVPEWRSWAEYDEREGRWKRDEHRHVLSLVATTMRNGLRAATDEDNEKRRKHLIAYFLKSENVARLRAAEELARSERRAVARLPEFDADSWLLNVSNGVIDLRTGKLRAHRREDLLLRQTPHEFRRDVQCPRFEQFLKEITAGDAELIAFLQRLAGYSLTGSTREHKVAILHGTGCNGKSVLLETLRDVFGDYGDVTRAAALLSQRDDNRPRNDIAALCGARFVTAEEPGQGRYLDEATVKEITGETEISARFLHREFFKFKPLFTLWLSTNHVPRIRGTDEGIWRRLLLIPFNQSFKGREDRDLPRKLRAEAPGILRWCVDGAVWWQREGLLAPEVVLHATADYRQSQDAVAAFIAERCMSEGCAAGGKLYAAYTSWCERNGESAQRNRDFAKELEGRGLSRGTGRERRTWLGISLRSSDGELDF